MDYRVSDPTRVWPVLQRSRDALADLGVHHVLVYTSTLDCGRVMVTMALRSKEPVLKVLRSKAFLNWFDAVGLEDIPAIFAGETVEKMSFVDPDSAEPPGVIVAVIAPVEDVATLITRVNEARPRFSAAKTRNLRIYQAFDDEHEAMILHEIKSEEDARRWIDNPDEVAEWMAGAGVGPYPPIFVGRFQHMMRIDEKR